MTSSIRKRPVADNRKHVPDDAAGMRNSQLNGISTAQYNSRASETNDHNPLSDPSLHTFPRISRPVELLRTSYDVVVIGSGYGGGVAASRMARGRQSVCLLERGKERWPGEFPVDLGDAAKELHVSGDFAPNDSKGHFVEAGAPTGLYHLVLGQGQNAFVGNGLGGTSLLNANIFLEMDPAVMKMNMWPKELRDTAAWETYYARARDVLEPQPYPQDYPALPKLDLLQTQADLLGFGDKFYRAPQTTRFASGPNSTGVEMSASTLTGQDATGINDSSKSSTLVNYLSDAWNWGAEMFCECEVRYVKKAPNGDGYNVYFAWHGNGRGTFKDNIYEDLLWVHAEKCVFIGAGSLGTTEILLRSKNMGLPLSTSVGTGMSGNGDILAFGYNTDYQTNALGNPAPGPLAPVGPCITGVIDCRDQPDPLDGFVIEEGTVPKALARFFQAMLETLPGSIAPTGTTPWQKIKSVFARLDSQIFGPYAARGSIEKTQIYLIMSHDSNQAILTLKDDKPRLQFLGVGRSEHVRHLNGILAKATNAVGGTFVNSPFYAALGQQEITVHAIGGAKLSSDGTGQHGVANHVGEVFDGNSDTIHNGLVVCDGALVPGALGVNPFATITALAERSVELVAKQKGIRIDYTTKNGILDLFGTPAFPVLDDKELEPALKDVVQAVNDQTNGISFTEVMSGFIHVSNKAISGSGHVGEDVPDDFSVAARVAKSNDETAQVFLSIKSPKTEELIRNGKHSAMLTGTFSHSKFPKSFMVKRGTFQLFNHDSRESDTKDLSYNFDMISPDGEIFSFNGYKVVNNSAALSPLSFWKATSTLYVTITRPSDGDLIGRGILRLVPRDLWSELKTLTATGQGLVPRLASMTSFLAYFIRSSLPFLLGPFAPLSYPSPTFDGFNHVNLVAHTYMLTAVDGVESTLFQYEPKPGANSPSKPVKTIFFIPGASVSQEIFALPTMRKNAIDYFTAAGYRCFIVVHRVGINIAAKKGYTSFDARLDVRAAFEQIRALQRQSNPASNGTTSTPEEKVYVVAHCIGALALGMGLLDGTIPASYIAGITASQVFLTPKFSAQNTFKINFPIPLERAWTVFAGAPWLDVANPPPRAGGLWRQWAIDQVLRLYPAWLSAPGGGTAGNGLGARGGAREFCTSVVCHRGSLIFGRLWSHANLNAATHAQLHRFLGGIHMRCLGHLMAMGRVGRLCAPPAGGPASVPSEIEPGADLVTRENLERLRGVPVFLFSGGENVVYDPQTTAMSLDLLRETFPRGEYERVVIEGKGHLDSWMGTSSWTDVYPAVLQRVDAVMRKQ